ncbi:MAG: hypothetical protein LBD67_06480 [Candidatus Accumulibacter sp.]|jgi:hypothetical protein|nr:hypothetical protein [Accumulibacter sp.]
MDWKEGFRKPKEIKNGLRTSSLSSVLAICCERVKNPFALSLPEHRQRLSPFVLSLSK